MILCRICALIVNVVSSCVSLNPGLTPQLLSQKRADAADEAPSSLWSAAMQMYAAHNYPQLNSFAFYKFPPLAL